MTTRLRRIGNVIVLIVPLALASCDSQPARLVGGGVTAPSNALVPHPSNGFTIAPMLVPSTIPFHTLPVSGCPSASPFATDFSLIVDQRNDIDLFLHEVGVWFFDVDGFDSPLIFSESDLATRFGSTLVTGGARRTFAFQPRFGCGLRSTPHRMSMRLLLLDRNGLMHERTLTAHAEITR